MTLRSVGPNERSKPTFTEHVMSKYPDLPDAVFRFWCDRCEAEGVSWDADQGEWTVTDDGPYFSDLLCPRCSATETDPKENPL